MNTIKLFLLCITLFCCFNIYSQDDEEEYVVTTNLKLRTEPNTLSNTNIIGFIEAGKHVLLLEKFSNEWWKIKFSDYEGYVYRKYLKEIEDPYKDWNKENVGTGEAPECSNIIPKYDYQLDNKLVISVSNGTDAVVKLMNEYSETCIRNVYIREGDTYYMRNIPEGIYYVKIAYGKDFKKTIIMEQCYEMFTKNAVYKKSYNRFDFYKEKEGTEEIGDEVYQKYSLPSYRLTLNTEDTISSGSTLNTGKISEEEFNK